MKADTLIVNATLVGPDGLSEGAAVAIDGRHIAAVGTTGTLDCDASETVDARGALLFPGLIDSHAHYREPGLEHKGNIATESRAAIAGGVTSFIDMPNTKPATVDAETLNDKYMRAERSSSANYGFFLAASDRTPAIIPTIDRSLLPGIKLFLGTTTGAMAAPAERALEDLFRLCADMNLPIMVHAEDDSLIAAAAAEAIARYGSREAVPVSEHHIIRSREACLRATARAVELAMRFGTRLHIAHVSTADEVREFLSSGPVSGKQITAETTPLYLDPVLCEPSARTHRHKINPAVKLPGDAEALREALADGRIDTIGTDHAPHLESEKLGGALTAASGAPSVQFALDVMLEYLRPELIARAMAANPAAIFAIGGRGRIETGMAADLTLVEHTSGHIISDADVITPAQWTPFAGREIHHRVARVWVNGREAFDSTHLASPGAAERLLFGLA
ncbi:MAG: amidohydrolase family protein [Muribaculaceae bacterium]|nr:amidohydrolase family protein [Muribaculaceae bacterium]